jgi:hypothetical protein
MTSDTAYQLKVSDMVSRLSTLTFNTTLPDSPSITSSGLVSKIDHSQLRTSNAHPITIDSSSSSDSSPLIVGPKESLSSTKILTGADLPPNRNSVLASFVGPESSQINLAKQTAEPNATPSFQPPAGSRLLAFARTSANNLQPSQGEFFSRFDIRLLRALHGMH